MDLIQGHDEDFGKRTTALLVLVRLHRLDRQCHSPAWWTCSRPADMEGELSHVCELPILIISPTFGRSKCSIWQSTGRPKRSLLALYLPSSQIDNRDGSGGLSNGSQPTPCLVDLTRIEAGLSIQQMIDARSSVGGLSRDLTLTSSGD